MVRKISLLLACFWLTLMLASAASAAFPVLRLGSRGTYVVQMQNRLKALGFFTGKVDGKFGASTRNAVKRFQTHSGLKPDGVVGAVTAQRMGLVAASQATPTPAPKATASPKPLAAPAVDTSADGDLYLLARVVYGESRGEPYIGQVAVAAVVLNRVKDKGFPNTIPGVVYQPNAFSIVKDNQINLAPNETAIRAARDAVNGMDPTGGALFYFNPAKTDNAFMHSRPELITIGNHRFCS